ncbi:hypothetical protein [Roseicella aerolata]|uniref:Uncharacterized protein n=1 Tax=Roseicella aerolata TaxID=2883479 RepID=A0A9X1IAD4_9PROT|nr:hypothetical protein [Roseicella aerolata]MCB4821181.1 hypothetical protein [Roseicella aerolata]
MPELDDLAASLLRLVQAVLLPPHAAPEIAPDLASAAFAAALGRVADGFRYIDVEAPDARIPAGLGFAPGFVRAMAAGAEALQAQRQAEILRRFPTLPPDGLPARGLDIAYALSARAKLVLCPFTGAWAHAARALGYETFWHGAAGRVCLVAQYTETTQTGQDTVWLFPAEKVALYFGSRVTLPILRHFLQECLLGLLCAPAAVAAHLRRPAPSAALALVEMSAPHFGHALWNASSAWARLFALPGLPRPDRYVTWHESNFLPPVTELYPEEAGRPLLRLHRPAELVRVIAETDSLALVAKDHWITEALARRVIDHAWRHAAPEALAALRALRRTAMPLVLLGLRLGNRVWLEQEEGLANLAAALQARFGAVGFIIDGLNAGTTMGWTHELMSLPEEMRLAGRLADRIGRHAPCLVTVGRSMAESLVASALCDVFVAPAGSGLAKYQWLANKPGVVVSNSVILDPGNPLGWSCRVFDGFRDGARPALRPDHRLVRDVGSAQRPGPMHADVSLDWRALLPSVIGLAEEAIRLRRA